MKRFVSEFFHRGLIAAGFGPPLLAVVYLVLQKAAGIEMLTVHQVCVGILSITALAFIAGGMNAIYTIEQLPLMAAILIHGCVLYFSYLATYLVNHWLARGPFPMTVFTVVFVVVYIIIWAIIYSVTKRNTDKLNRMLTQKQQQILGD